MTKMKSTTPLMISTDIPAALLPVGDAISATDLASPLEAIAKAKGNRADIGLGIVETLRATADRKLEACRIA